MKRIFQAFTTTACILLIFSLISAFATDKESKATTQGIAVDSMDRSVVPGDDFYSYANGTWIQKTEIPPDRSGVGVFSRVADLTNKRLADLIEELAKSNAPAGSSARQIAISSTPKWMKRPLSRRVSSL